jgi:hypothetical protein
MFTSAVIHKSDTDQQQTLSNETVASVMTTLVRNKKHRDMPIMISRAHRLIDQIHRGRGGLPIQNKMTNR